MKQKRILIISHNPINTTDNMGKTLGNIFSGFDEKELCQLYFREQNVEAKNCEKFFCIDDVSMVKSVINRFYKTGKIVKNNTIIKKPNEAEEEIFQKGKKRTGSIYILRNLLWRIGKWNTKELKAWLKEMNPSAIFFAAGDYTFSFNIALKISKMFNIPLYVYYTDEYYRKDSTENKLISRIAKSQYRRVFRKIMKNCKNYFTITQNMLEFYEKEFSKRGMLLVNITELYFEPQKYSDKTSLNISYIGNLGYGRWKNIIEIKEMIDEINSNARTRYNLKVYSGEKDKNILTAIKTSLNTEEYQGEISKEAVIEKMKDADILIHVEGFEEVNKERVKYSLSTKIPDILASKRIMLAYGPKDVASIQYIYDNNVGLIANNKEELKTILQDLIENKIDVKQILENANNLIEKNHRIKDIHKILYATMMEE